MEGVPKIIREIRNLSSSNSSIEFLLIFFFAWIELFFHSSNLLDYFYKFYMFWDKLYINICKVRV